VHKECNFGYRFVIFLVEKRDEDVENGNKALWYRDFVTRVGISGLCGDRFFFVVVFIEKQRGRSFFFEFEMGQQKREESEED